MPLLFSAGSGQLTVGSIRIRFAARLLPAWGGVSGNLHYGRNMRMQKQLQHAPRPHRQHHTAARQVIFTPFPRRKCPKTGIYSIFLLRGRHIDVKIKFGICLLCPEYERRWTVWPF